MPNPLPSTRLTFEENIQTLLDELTLAEKWQRPSILLVVHKSKYGQDKAQTELESRLKQLGTNVVRMLVDEKHSDVPHWILSTPDLQQSVFFVSNIDWGGGADRKDAYRALNIYRELLVDPPVRAVFWLTSNEAATLPRLALDFWAFRHRVIEFTGQRIPRRATLPAGALIWDIQNSVDPFDALQARISVREALLAKLPHNAEANSSRIDLLYNLGYLHWALGNLATALDGLKAGLDLLTGGEPASICTSLLNGLAIIAFEGGQLDKATDYAQEAIKQSPRDALTATNLAIILCARGRNKEAVALANKAAKLGERDARIWSGFGHILAITGKFDEAISCFDKAAALAPRMAAHHSALAICYDAVERPEECRRQLELARGVARDPGLVFQDIYETALLASPVKSLEVAGAAIQSGRVSALDLRRDPNLNLLLDSAQLLNLAP